MIQRIATKALIVNNGKILLLREASYDEGPNKGRYQVPGGRVNIGEPFADALRREVMEETGLNVEVGQPLYVGEWWPTIKGEPNQIIAIFFVCRAKSTDVKLGEEHDEYQMINPADYVNFDMMEPEDLVIQRYIDQNEA